MQPACALTQTEIFELLQNVNKTQLATAVLNYSLTIESVQQLKAFAADFHYTDPKHALEIAQVAYRLGLSLSGTAAALGAWVLGNALMHNARYTESAKMFDFAREKYLAAGQELDVARLSVGHVGVLAYLGERDRALSIVATSEQLLSKAAEIDRDDLERLCWLLNALAVLYDLSGQYEEALTVYERQIPIAKRLENQLLLAHLYHNRAYALGQINAFSEALSAYQKAEELFHSLNTKADLVKLYINLSNLYALYGQDQEVSQIHKKAQYLLAELPGMEQARHRLTLLQIEIYVKHQQLISDEILQDLHAAQQSFHLQGPQLEEGIALILLGDCYRLAERFSDATYYYHQVPSLVQNNVNRVLTHRALQGLAQIAHSQGDRAKAVTIYQQAIDSFEAIRHELHIELFRSSFLRDKLEIYRELAGLYIAQKQSAAAFQVIERAKSRLIMEKLTFRLQKEIDTAKRTNDEVVQHLAATLDETLVQLEALYQQHAREQKLESTTEQERVAVEVRSVESTVQQLIQQIQQHRPLFSTASLGQVTSLVELQSLLQGSAFLQYYKYAGECYVFVITNEGIRTHLRLAPFSQIMQVQQALALSIESFLGMLVGHGPERTARYLPALLQETNDHLQKLYMLLLHPLLPHLADEMHIIVAPDDLLHYIPFHALYNGEQYLLEQYEVSYVPSATVLDLCLQQSFPAEGALFCGYDNGQLSAVSTEINQLASIIPGAECLVGEDATTGAFTKQALNKKLIHLAAHASFRVDNPMLSSISLADRRLTLAEIGRLALSANLAVLNGCDTGQGDLQGADLLSLASGFISAGVRSLVTTLWRIEDKSAAEIMQHFYTIVYQGQRHSTALRQAQILLLDAGRHALGIEQLQRHPALWAPYFLIGDPYHSS